jgi:hypothetical protein
MNHSTTPEVSSKEKTARISNILEILENKHESALPVQSEDVSNVASDDYSAIYIDPCDWAFTVASINNSLKVFPCNLFSYRERVCWVGKRESANVLKEEKYVPPRVKPHTVCPGFFASLLKKNRKILKKTQNGWIPIKFSYDLAAEYLVDISNWILPTLVAVICHPVIDLKWNIIETEGYHPDSGLYIDFDGVKFPPITLPTAESRALVHSFLDECKFDSEISRAAGYSYLMTCLLSKILPRKPLFLITSPEAGLGKSALMDAGHILATGFMSDTVDWPDSDAEMEKRVLGCLMAGDPIICFDNVETGFTVKSKTICKATSQNGMRARRLHTHDMMSAPCDAMFVVTGNSCVISGDLSIRSIICRLCSKDCRASGVKRKRKRLEIQAQEQRSALVVAFLMEVHAAKFLEFNNKTFEKSFLRCEDWDRMVRATAINFGCEDPVKCLEIIDQEDPDEGIGITIWEMWHEKSLPNVAYTISKMLEINANLKEYLEETFQSKDGKYSSIIAGGWIAKNASRIFGSIRLDRIMPDYRGVKQYKSFDIPVIPQDSIPS